MKIMEFYDNNPDEEEGAHFKRLLPPNVFLDISIAGEYIGRIEIELYPDCPKTADNFRKLCSGREKNENSVKLHYKNCMFHRIIPRYMIQSGDFIKNDGTSGWSIYGEYFPIENFHHKHDNPYKIAMSNLGNKDTQNS